MIDTRSPSGAMNDLKSTNPGIARARASIATAITPLRSPVPGRRRERDTVSTSRSSSEPLITISLPTVGTVAPKLGSVHPATEVERGDGQSFSHIEAVGICALDP